MCFAIAVAISAAVGGCTSEPQPERDITIVFIRHGESAGNTSGLIDTSVPGPELTDRGRDQAAAAADRVRSDDVDGVYASTMIRTQQTAEYTAAAVEESVTVLPGLREIEAGDYEGTPEQNVAQYLAVPLEWIAGQRDERIPGSLDGNEFDRRFDEAVEQIYAAGDTHPIAFSHGGAIMIWALLNVDDPDTSLLTRDPLGNTGSVVVTGNPTDGWRLVEWSGAAGSR